MPIKERDMISMSDPRVCQIGHPAPPWLVNYADLMTELVCFFVILYALSASLNKDVAAARKEVQEVMKQEEIAGEVTVTKEGMFITVEESGEDVFFESGSAQLSEQIKNILEKIAPAMEKLAEANHEVVVEGHTDDVPIHTARFASNWELSTARATSVVQHMLKHFTFPPDRLAAIGYGEHRPLYENDTDEGRAGNRRVVFFVKNKPIKFKDKDAAEEDAAEVAQAAVDEDEALYAEEEELTEDDIYEPHYGQDEA